MGLTYIEGEVFQDETSPNKIPLKFLIDSGASYSLLPAACWKALELLPQGTLEVELADGRTLKRPISECRFSLMGLSRSSPVLLGEEDDEALIGVVTLENFGLVLDPLKRKLIPIRAKL